FGQAITLREQPLANIQERTQLLGPARVMEVRRANGWVEVEAWDCDGEHHAGWIQTHETNDLDPADREVCHPGNALPQLIVEAGKPFIQAWDELFSTELRSEHTRQTYQRACRRFFDFCGMDGVSLDEIQGLHISAWRDILAKGKSSSTVRQSLIALRRLFDAFVARQLLPMNPARSIPLPRRTRSRT
ncbi:MAG TPA: site-specific integrase, partial [Alphaproteobacteria bacterium]|nr:site-specific integrase [Alphaproteobacteria bacterium]